MLSRAEEIYVRIRQHIARHRDLRNQAIGALLGQLFEESLNFLRGRCVDLISQVAGKRYFAFQNGTKLSRAVNADLYLDSADGWSPLLTAISRQDFSSLPAHNINRVIYSAAISFCALIDLTRRADQKTPGTFFEYLIGHLFAARLGLNPTKRLPVLNLDMNTTLPTDFIFDLGPGRAKFHLPIKTSTRERVIQVWAHQRVLDGVYGTGRFLGTPVILAETKTDFETKKVVEICLPDQWLIYQMHIAQLKRVYYLDVPVPYARLTGTFPRLYVKAFGDFFHEVDTLIE